MKYICFLIIFLVHSTCIAGELPDAPEGYNWYISVNKIGTFLKPQGWFVKEEKIKDTNALFITKEKIQDNSGFITGLSINQFNNFSRTSVVKPSQYAKNWAIEMGRERNVLQSFKIDSGNESMFGIRVVGVNHGVPTIVHFLSVGIDKEDKVYSIIFETPEQLWDANFKIAKPMLNAFSLGE